MKKILLFLLLSTTVTGTAIAKPVNHSDIDGIFNYQVDSTMTEQLSSSEINTTDNFALKIFC